MIADQPELLSFLTVVVVTSRVIRLLTILRMERSFDDMFDEQWPLNGGALTNVKEVEMGIKDSQVSNLDSKQIGLGQNGDGHSKVDETENLNRPGSSTSMCTICLKVFTRASDLKRHLQSHSKDRFACTRCGAQYARRDILNRHVKAKHPVPPKKRWAKYALNGSIMAHAIPGGENDLDLNDFLHSSIEEVKALLASEITEKRSVKWYAVAQVLFQRPFGAKENEYCMAYFRSHCVTSLTMEKLDDEIRGAMEKIKAAFDAYEGRGSGWVLDRVIQLELNGGCYEPLMSSRR